MKNKELRIETPLTSVLFQKASINKIPLSGIFELSPLCNFDCKMCYIHQSSEQVRNHPRKMLSLDKWKMLADEAEKAGMLYLLLTGGEPLLWKDFWEFYEYVAGRGFVLSINTNGSLIDETVVERFKNMPPSRINITLYGASDETYEAMCGVKNVFNKVDSAITSLMNAGIQVKLNCSLTPHNVKDLEKMVDYAKRRNLILEVNPYMFPPIRNGKAAMVEDNSRFTPEETAYWHLKKYRLQNGEAKYREFLKNIVENIEMPLGLECSSKDDADGKVRCRAGSSSFWITWDGYMLPCGMMTKPRTDLLDNTFEESWKQTVSAVESIKVAGACQKCTGAEICHSCAAMALTETENFHAIPKYLCEMVFSLNKIASEQLKIYDTEK